MVARRQQQRQPWWFALFSIRRACAGESSSAFGSRAPNHVGPVFLFYFIFWILFRIFRSRWYIWWCEGLNSLLSFDHRGANLLSLCLEMQPRRPIVFSTEAIGVFVCFIFFPFPAGNFEGSLHPQMTKENRISSYDGRLFWILLLSFVTGLFFHGFCDLWRLVNMTGTLHRSNLVSNIFSLLNPPPVLVVRPREADGEETMFVSFLLRFSLLRKFQVYFLCWFLSLMSGRREEKRLSHLHSWRW